MPYSDLATDIAPETGLQSETATGEELYRVGLAYSEGVDCERTDLPTEGRPRGGV